MTNGIITIPNAIANAIEQLRHEGFGDVAIVIGALGIGQANHVAMIQLNEWVVANDAEQTLLGALANGYTI